MLLLTSRIIPSEISERTISTLSGSLEKFSVHNAPLPHHIVGNMALFINPWKPSLLIQRIIFMKIDSCRDIGGILILCLQIFLYTGQMNQLKHLAPVNSLILLNGKHCIFNCAFYKLHLFYTVLNQLFLDI